MLCGSIFLSHFQHKLLSLRDIYFYTLPMETHMPDYT